MQRNDLLWSRADTYFGCSHNFSLSSYCILKLSYCEKIIWNIRAKKADLNRECRGGIQIILGDIDWVLLLILNVWHRETTQWIFICSMSEYGKPHSSSVKSMLSFFPPEKTESRKDNSFFRKMNQRCALEPRSRWLPRSCLRQFCSAAFLTTYVFFSTCKLTTIHSVLGSHVSLLTVDLVMTSPSYEALKCFTVYLALTECPRWCFLHSLLSSATCLKTNFLGWVI